MKEGEYSRAEVPLVVLSSNESYFLLGIGTEEQNRTLPSRSKVSICWRTHMFVHLAWARIHIYRGF